MKLYKLTDSINCTLGDTQWGENVTHTATGPADGDLCSSSWIHAYESPLLAILLNPIHANFVSPQLWEATGKIKKRDHGLKVGCRRLKTLRQIPLPKITIEHRVRFAILCSIAVYKDKSFLLWAAN